MSETSPRYAIYYAPDPTSALGRFGAAWLGRDAIAGRPAARPASGPIAPDRLAAITAAPARYGFHATLKPPFRLAAGARLDDLRTAADQFARGRMPFPMPPLMLGALDGFLALVPAGDAPALHALADAAVAAFDHLRAPPSADELARRGAGLDPARRALLARWGYPFVFAAYRFHITLTDRLEDAERARVRRALAPLVAEALAEPARVEAVWIFEEPAPGAAFRAIRRVRFG